MGATFLLNEYKSLCNDFGYNKMELEKDRERKGAIREKMR